MHAALYTKCPEEDDLIFYFLFISSFERGGW